MSTPICARLIPILAPKFVQHNLLLSGEVIRINDRGLKSYDVVVRDDAAASGLRGQVLHQAFYQI